MAGVREMQVGQKGELAFLPTTVGIDPARITRTRWVPQPPSTSVKYTAPNIVEALAVGSRPFRLGITLSPLTAGDPEEQITYAFTLTVIAPLGPPEPPVEIPVTLVNVLSAPVPGVPPPVPMASAPVAHSRRGSKA